MAYPPFYSSSTPPFYATSTTISVPSPNLSLNHGYTSPSPNPYTPSSPNPYPSSTSYSNPYGYGYSSYYNREQQQPPLPYSQPQPPPPYSNPYGYGNPEYSAYFRQQPNHPYHNPANYQTYQNNPISHMDFQKSLHEFFQAYHKSTDNLRAIDEQIQASRSSIKASFQKMFQSLAALQGLQEEIVEDEELVGDGPEKPHEETELLVVHEQPPKIAVHLAKTGTETTISPEKWKSTKSTAGDNKSTSPELKPPSTTPELVFIHSLTSSQPPDAKPPPPPRPPDLSFSTRPPPPKPPESGTFKGRDGSFTAVKLSFACVLVTISLLKPPEYIHTPAPPPKPPDPSFQKVDSTMAPPSPNLPDQNFQRPIVESQVSCEPTRPPPLPEPPDQNFRTVGTTRYPPFDLPTLKYLKPQKYESSSKDPVDALQKKQNESLVPAQKNPPVGSARINYGRI